MDQILAEGSLEVKLLTICGQMKSRDGKSPKRSQKREEEKKEDQRGESPKKKMQVRERKQKKSHFSKDLWLRRVKNLHVVVAG